MDVIRNHLELPEPDQDDQAAKVFPHDRYLMAAAASVTRKLTPTEKLNAREYLAEFMHLSVANKTKIMYSQHRPFTVDVNPEKGYVGDCSSFATQSDYWTWDRLDGVPYHDSNGVVEWDGYGYTGTTLATNHGHQVPKGHRYLVGDIAICGTFWNTVHEFRCYQPGTAKTSVWCSHGSSPGPFFVTLNYRPDVFGVYRPVSLL